MVIFDNLRDNSQLATIARQIRPDKMKFLMRAYKDATSSPHTYLMLDLKPDTEERFRVRSNIWKIHNMYILRTEREICKVTMVSSACLRTLRRICILIALHWSSKAQKKELQIQSKRFVNPSSI